MIKRIGSSESVSSLAEKMEGLSKASKLFIIVGTLVLIVVVYGFFFFLDHYRQYNKLRTEDQNLTKRLEISKKNAQEIDKIKAKYEKAQVEFNTAKKKLPESEEIPNLLTQVSESGQIVGLEFLQFAPRKEIPKDFYAEIPVSVKVKGGFHDTVVFFDRVAHLSRIVQIRDIGMKPDNSDDISTDCTAVTYKFVDQKEDPEKDKRSKKK